MPQFSINVFRKSAPFFGNSPTSTTVSGENPSLYLRETITPIQNEPPTPALVPPPSTIYTVTLEMTPEETGWLMALVRSSLDRTRILRRYITTSATNLQEESMVEARFDKVLTRALDVIREVIKDSDGC